MTTPLTASGPWVRRGGLDDWYVVGDRSAVLVGGRVLLLSELATVVVELVGESGLGLDSLADALGKHFGAPPAGSPTEATAEAVRVLVHEGVLATGDR
ncbi:MAG: PqqD family protein [Marmoricola sp.]|jgi:hypothetical protein|nr:PqqD family protein [Marmoricola sp.]